MDQNFRQTTQKYLGKDTLFIIKMLSEVQSKNMAHGHAAGVHAGTFSDLIRILDTAGKLQTKGQQQWTAAGRITEQSSSRCTR
jgi:hypothetical protein